MVIYLDLYFLTNLIIDSVLLYTTAWTRKIRPAHFRIAAAAILGAVYVVMMFVPAMSFMFTFAVKAIFALVMIVIAFGFGSLQHYLRNLGMFYLINFIAAGMVLGVYYFTLPYRRTMRSIFQSGFFAEPMHLTFIVLFVSFAIAILFYRIVMGSAKARQAIEGYYAEVKVTVNDEVYSCTGLIDTGNRLYDPLTRTPVMVMEAAKWRNMLPEAWLPLIEKAQVEQIIAAIGTEECVLQDRLRLVPYRGINRSTQFMLALKPDKVVIQHNGKSVEASKVLIGLDGGKLCADGAYEAIIHPALMEAP